MKKREDARWKYLLLVYHPRLHGNDNLYGKKINRIKSIPHHPEPGIQK